MVIAMTAAATVTAALAVLVGSATLATLTVCVPAVPGALYSPAVEIVPTVALPPLTPSTYQVTAVFVVPVTVAVNCFVVIPGTEAEVGLMLIATADVVTLTAALADFVASALLVTLTVCEPTAAGALYNPAVEMVPTVAFPPLTPSTYQVTAVFVVPVTVAVNCFVVIPGTEAEVGLMVKVATADVVTLTAALADFVASALLVAFTVCEPAAAGALYNPAVEMVPTVAFPPFTPSTDHVTVALVEPLTVAVNC
jgi:hypothetical protein